MRYYVPYGYVSIPTAHSNLNHAMNRLACFKKSTRNVLFILVSACFFGNAQAEWLMLGRASDFRIYLDQKLMQRNGDFAQVWQLVDFTIAQWADARTAVWSIKNLVEYDCIQPRLRTLAGEAYSEQMGAGRLLANEQAPNPQWEAIEANSTPDKIRQLACGKK